MGKVHRRGVAVTAKDAKKRKKRSCRSAPAAPANVTIGFHKSDEKNRKWWRARVAWDQVTADVAGRAMTPERYAVELRATDASGEPVETALQTEAARQDGADFTVHAGSATDLGKATRLENNSTIVKTTLTGLTAGIATAVEMIARKENGGDSPVMKLQIWNVTDGNETAAGNGTPDSTKPKTVVVRNFTPVAGKTYEARVHSVSGTGKPLLQQVQWRSKGDAAVWRTRVESDDDPLKASFADLPKPNQWYFQARVRAMNRHDGKRCWSAWSSWTAAQQPVGGELTGPPAPDGLSLAFDTNESKKFDKWQAVCTWNETPWWVPPDGEAINGAVEYGIRFQVSEDGVNPVRTRRITVPAKDADADTTASVEFGRIRKRRYYRFYVRARSADGWWGAWGGPTSWLRATQTVGVPVNVNQTRPTPGIIKATWDPPSGADADDIDYYRVRVYQGAGAANLRETVKTRAEHYRYHVPDADRGTPHRIKVTAVDNDGNLSTEVDEGTDLSETGTWDGSIITPGTLDVYGGLTMSLKFSTSVTDADPGNGYLRLNNATQSGATQAFVDLLDENGVDWTGTLDTFDDSTGTVKGSLRIWNRADPTKWVTAYLTAVTTATGYRKLSLSSTTGSSATPFANDDPLSMAFVRAGDAGTDGTDGTDGSDAPLTMLLSFSTTTTDADPGNGIFRLNNATQNLATQAFVDLLDSNGTSWTTTLDTFDDAIGSIKGAVRFQHATDATKWIDTYLTAVTTATGYRKLVFTVTGSSAASPFANLDQVKMTFTRAGNVGNPGGTTMPLTFSTTTTDADPGNGLVRLNNATQTSASLIYLDLLDRNGTTWTSVIDTWDDNPAATRGHLKFTHSTDPSKWLTFNITGATTTATGYRKLAVSNTGGSASSPFANNDLVDLSFTAAGLQGPTGPSGAPGDGSRPGNIPSAPVATGTIGAIVVRWSPVVNNDPVTYEVHVGTTSGFTVSASTKVAQLAGTMTFVKTADSSGTPLAVLDDNGDFVDYYVKIVPKDVDGEYSGTGTFDSPNYSTPGGYTASNVVNVAQATGEDIAAAQIDASHIIAGSITASELNAELGGFGTLIAGAYAEDEALPKVVLSGNGVRIEEVVGGVANPVANFPTSSEQPAFVKGTVQAKGLSVENDLALFGDNNSIEAGARITLQSKTESPKTAPVVSAAWDLVEYAPDTHGFAAANPLTWWKGMTFDSASSQFYTVAFNGLSWRILVVDSNETGGFDVVASNQLPYSVSGGVPLTTTYYMYHGAARIGASIYLLRSTNLQQGHDPSSTKTGYQIHKINATTFAAEATYTLAAGIDLNLNPAFGTDGTDLYVLDRTGSNPRWRRYNTSGVLQATTTSTGTPALAQYVTEFTGFYIGNGDFGSQRVAICSSQSNNVYVYSAGAYQANESFYGPTNSLYGVTYANGVFYTLRDPGGSTSGVTPSKYVNKHSTWTWTTASSVYNIAYTFRVLADSQESATSPVTTHTQPRRAKMLVTVGALPNGATGWKIYRKLSTGSASSYSAADATAVTTAYTSFTSGSASLPATSSFNAGTDAKFTSYDGSPLLTARGYPRASYTYTSAGNVNNGVGDEYIAFGTQVTDTDGFYSDAIGDGLSQTYAAASHRWTVPYNGQYQIFFRVVWAASGNGRRVQSIETSTDGSSWSVAEGFTYAPVSGATTRAAWPAVLNLSAGNYIRFSVWQNSGGALALNSARVHIIYLGPT